MSAAFPIDSVRDLLGLAPTALFGSVATEAVGRAEREVESTHPGERLQDVASRMWWRKMGALAVLEEGRLVGVLTEDDLLHAVADRLAQKPGADGALPIWETLLPGATVRDAMTPRDDAAVVPLGTPLVDGLQATFGPTRRSRRKSYLFAVDGADVPQRVISFRDIARYLMRLYDGQLPAGVFPTPAEQAEAQRVAWRVLDVSLGQLREQESLGSPPDPLAPDAGFAQTIERMTVRARGYAMVELRGKTGAVMRGICTRRDLLRALKNPFATLESLRALYLMTEPVKIVTEVDTLCGLFKMMAIEGFRHMPLVDETDHVDAVISMWQGVGLLAHRPARKP
jgi:CBS domain-containing protein